MPLFFRQSSADFRSTTDGPVMKSANPRPSFPASRESALKKVCKSEQKPPFTTTIILATFCLGWLCMSF